jgi:hypothetical protein
MSPKVDITPADVNSAAGTFAREQSTLADTWNPLAQVLDADGWTMAAQSLKDLITGLSHAVTAITDNNRTDCLAAMQEFWDALAGPYGLLGELTDTCHQLAAACNSYAQAIDDAHDRLKTALIEAGIAIGLTTVVGGLLSLVTFGASDVAAAAADVAEVEEIVVPIVEKFEATVATETETAIGADVAASLESIAADAPTIEAVEAETTEIQSAVDAELRGTDIPARPTDVGSEVEVPGTEGTGEVPAPHGSPGTLENLNSQQAANYQRYANKLPAKNEGVDIELLNNGGVRLSSKVPANNVPGSYAEYIKILDKEGNTVQYVKNTYAPDGTIVHSKIK